MARVLWLLLLVLLWWVEVWAQPVPVVAYDIVYVRSPRTGDTASQKWPEVKFPFDLEPGTDLVLRRADGTQEVLFLGEQGAVLDPAVSFDAQTVYFSYCPDMRLSARNGQRSGIPVQGCDLYKIQTQTLAVTRLTHQEWTPIAGTASWSTTPLTADSPTSHYLGYGILNTGPCPLPGGKLMFTSSRNGLLPNKNYTAPNLQLFVLDEASGIVEQVGHLNLGSALHPTVLTDGRVAFSSYESQGLRDKRLWGLWVIHPDGSGWEPLMSAFTPLYAPLLHFQTQLSDGRVVAQHYYIQNTNSFGTFMTFPLYSNMIQVPRWGSPDGNHASNPSLHLGYRYANDTPRIMKYSFSPAGLAALTSFAHDEDGVASQLQGQYQGKVTHPSAAPQNDLLLVWSGGPAHPSTPPQVDGGLYLLKGGQPAMRADELVLVLNDPAYNEMQPKALVPYQAIYGLAAPATLPWKPNDGTVSPHLPAGTAHGIVGTSSMCKRNTAPGYPSNNWWMQGADVGTYTCDDIHTVRLVLEEPTVHRSYGPLNNGDTGPGNPDWFNHGNERYKVLGELPLRKVDAQGLVILDPEGNPDTSWKAKIPCDMAFTFQTLDANGSTLNVSQTWHQLTCGEQRDNCGGCHAHAQHGLSIAATAAGQPGYVPAPLHTATPWTVEWSDIEAHVREHCGSDCAGKTVEQIATAYTKPYQSRLSLLLGKLTTAPEPLKRQVRAWIDLGTPWSLRPAPVQPVSAWKEQTTRPALTLRLDRQAPVSCPVGCTPTATQTVLQIGLASVYQTLDLASLRVTLGAVDVTSQLVWLNEAEGIKGLPLAGTGQAVVVATVCDQSGPCTERRLAASW